jgi:gas vesicle protein
MNMDINNISKEIVEEVKEVKQEIMEIRQMNLKQEHDNMEDKKNEETKQQFGQILNEIMYLYIS